MSEAPQHLLVVDDNQDIRLPLSRYLRENGFRVSTADCAHEARKILQRSFVNLIILDIMMPQETGLDFCRDARKSSNLPIIFLSAKITEIDRIVGLEVGADDYVTKPFSPRELLARVRALLKRAEAAPYSKPKPDFETYLFGGWRYDCARRELRDRSGVATTLSKTEGRLLNAFVRKPQTILSRFDLICDVYGNAMDRIDDRNIDTHVSRLRRKLMRNTGAEDYIKTIWGEGYMLLPTVELLQ